MNVSDLAGWFLGGILLIILADVFVILSAMFVMIVRWCWDTIKGDF